MDNGKLKSECERNRMKSHYSSTTAERLAYVIEAIEKSRHLREELIAIGLSPMIVQDGIRRHIQIIDAGQK